MARGKFCNILSTNLRKGTINKLKSKFLAKIYDDTAKFLKRHKDIVIVDADKGNLTVAMYKNEYLEKLETILSDRTTYRTMRKDPTNALQVKNNESIRDLTRSGYMTEREKHMLTTYKAQSPKIYGLPKIHKEGCPLRPIVSTVNSPTYRLSKFLADVLKNLTTNSKFNVKNSKELKQKLTNMHIDDTEILVSFDVVSLFSNIPVQICLEIVGKNWHKISSYTKIPKNKFLDLLRFCIDDGNYFAFNNRVYRQSFGLPMGSPLSPILADILMEHLLDKALDSLPYTPRIFVKYVDDLLAIVPRSEVDSTLRILNSYHRRLQFTVEKEERGFIPYLDMKLIRHGNTVITDWYQKITSSGRLINFNSFHPKHIIINTANNFISTVLDISHPRFHYKNVSIIDRILSKNSFPKKVIHDLIWRYTSRKRVDRGETATSQSNVERSYIFRSSVYIPDTSEKFKKMMSSLNDDLRIAFRAKKTVKGLFSKLKDRIPKENVADVVYKISCGGRPGVSCNSQYIGTTGQMLKNRIANHKSDIKNNYSSKTALAAHCLSLNHTPVLDDVAILAKENNYAKRHILEALHIQTTEETINRRTDTDNISTVYCSLLNSRFISR